MAESPADRKVIARAFGGMVVQCAHTPGPASYDDLGQRFVFVPGTCAGDATFAIDVERRNQSPPEALARELGLDNAAFFRHWTELEIIAKLCDMPILALLHQDGVALSGISVTRADTPEYCIALGKRVMPSAPS